jgi:hypothetical protein
MTSNELTCTAEFSETDALAALETARAAIARWSGPVRPSAELPKDISRVSPQARWVDQAQRNLAQWIAHGGFAQLEGADQPLPHLMRPVMFSAATCQPGPVKAYLS